MPRSRAIPPGQLPLFHAAPPGTPPLRRKPRGGGAGGSAVLGPETSAQTPCLLYTPPGASDTDELRLRIDGFDLPCRLRRRPGRMSLALAGGHVALGCPRWVSRRALNEFVQESGSWLRQRIRASRDLNPPTDVLGRKQLLIGGRLCSIEIINAGASARSMAKPSIAVDDGVLVIRESPRAAALLKMWMRERVATWLDGFLPAPRASLGAEVRQLRIKDFRAQWGSCIKARQGGYNISLNSRLAMMPEWVAGYVAIHELCHCRVYDHSPRFWSLLDEQLAHFLQCTSKDARRWLARHDALLRVDFDHLLGKKENVSSSAAALTLAHPDAGAGQLARRH